MSTERAQQAIWKYPIRLVDNQRISMPADAKILTVMVQRDQPCLWAIVDPDNADEEREIEIIGTGNPMPTILESRAYIGSIIADPFVWHVFEVR